MGREERGAAGGGQRWALRGSPRGSAAPARARPVQGRSAERLGSAASTCALLPRQGRLARPLSASSPAGRWRPGLGREDVVRGWGCVPRGLAMAREDSVKCLRCLLYALNLLFWVSGATRAGPGWAPAAARAGGDLAARVTGRARGARQARLPLTAGLPALGEGVEGVRPMPGSSRKGIPIT